MRRTINFHNQSSFLAKEIDNECPDRHLAAKFQTPQASVAQHLPQNLFRLCGDAAHLTGAGLQNIVPR